MHNKEQIYYLLNQYETGRASIPEQDELFALLATGEYDKIIGEYLDEALEKPASEKEADLPPHIAQEIMRTIIHAEKLTGKVIPVQRKTNRWYWAAASILLLISVSFFWYLKKPEKKEIARNIPIENKPVTNNTDKASIILLSDGSRITLEPGGKLFYPEKFAGKNREVYLEGMAFFDISPDPNHPFLVFGKHTVTKVLGTSFWVQTGLASEKEVISVRTGKVQVSEIKEESGNPAQQSSVIITPNQKAVYAPDRRLFETTLVDNPQPVQTAIKEKTAPAPVWVFNYEQETLDKVFSELEKAYSIEIIPENPAVSRCLFTGDVSGVDLFTKLRIICLSTGTSYEINGTRILIKGNGCQ